jgi:hypothetical protein
VLRRAVPFDGVAVVRFDPATELPVDSWADNSRAGGANDVGAFRQLAASGQRVARLSELPRAHGLGDEIRAVHVGESGLWGRDRDASRTGRSHVHGARRAPARIAHRV